MEKKRCQWIIIVIFTYISKSKVLKKTMCPPKLVTHAFRKTLYGTITNFHFEFPASFQIDFSSFGLNFNY